MRRFTPFALLLLATTAGCGGGVQDGNRAATNAPADATANAADAEMSQATPVPPELPAPRSGSVSGERETGPDIDPVSAPGIAFDYRYAFRMEADRIAGMQREHQQLCARYGSRCRVTGVNYRAANAEDVEAMLSFAVDTDIAAQFSRESVRAVTAADGDVTESTVDGTDVGTPLKANAGELETLQAELARVEERLAQRNLRWAERVRLDEQRQSLRQQIAALGATTDRQEQSLATTPILFRYGSGAYAPGPAREATIGEATERAADNFLGALKFLLIVLVSVSPWILLGLLLWVGFRAARKRWPVQPAAPTSPPDAAGA